MRVIGIICEYNPFHNGHIYQMTKSREIYHDSHIVAVMSGHFAQRGEASMLNKFARARAAVLHGADLVIELPFAYAVRSAEQFAKGGVKMLSRLGVVDSILFGAENPDTEKLGAIASISVKRETQAIIHKNMMNGLSYAAALEKALNLNDEEKKLIREPNNILAIEYMKAINEMKSTMEPLAIARLGAHHCDKSIDGQIASGTAIRSVIQSSQSIDSLKGVLPNEIFCEISNKNSTDFPSVKNLYRPLLSEILLHDSAHLKKIFGINEGLENKFIKAGLIAKSFDDFLGMIKSRRYPMTRLMRTILYIMLGVTKDMINIIDASAPPYARILAFNDNGRKLIRKIKENSDVEMITKISHHLNKKFLFSEKASVHDIMMMLDARSSLLYALCHKNTGNFENTLKTSPVYVKS